MHGSGKSRIFDKDLRRLQDEVVILGGMVKNAIVDALDVLERRDLEGLQQLSVQYQQIARNRFTIEMGCLSLIATQRLINGNLRTVVAMLEIANELARIGGCAKGMANARCVTLERPFFKRLTDVYPLAAAVLDLFHKALVAFVRKDVDLARTVVAECGALEALHSQVLQGAIQTRQNRSLTCLFRASRNLRRAGDRVSRICEWVAFEVEGTTADLEADQPPQASMGISLQQQTITV